MKICFVANHKHWGGLDNNGGSKTIIRSAETLNSLSHKAVILTNSNKYTWHKPKCKIVSETKHPEKFDVAVAVSVSEIDNVLKFPKKVRKVWWCRGYETWQMKKTTIQKKSKQIETLVNSSWLLQKFPHGRVAFAGLDLDFWGEIKGGHENIGGLINGRHKTKRSDLVKKYATIRLINTPHGEKLKLLYNSCNIWFAPTELEGFHNVPAEANLCGCLIVCNRLDSNGMGDFATEDTAMRYTGYDEMLNAIENPDFSKVAKMQKLLREKIGSRIDNMKKFVKMLGEIK